MPVSGHIKALEKYLGVVADFSITIITPSPSSIANFKEEIRRFLFGSVTFKRSITTSISCVLYLSNFREGVISIISPSTLTFKYPFLAN